MIGIVADVIAEATARFERAGVTSPRVDAEWMLADILGYPRSTLLLHREDALTIEQAARLDEMIVRRERREPLGYILGNVRFRGLTLDVGPGALVPRPETELVAERAIDLVRERCVRSNRPTVVDVGTGTGAIALSIAVEAPDARIYATESSAAARGWTLRNLAHTGLRVTLLPGSLLGPLHPSLGSNCDVIVANLPYLSEEEWELTEPEVRRYEPREALVGGPTGLEPLVDLIEEAQHWLSHAGWLVLEIGETQGEDVSRFMTASGYREVSIRKDLAGRDRIVEGRWTMLL